jgi:hypothetical protein
MRGMRINRYQHVTICISFAAVAMAVLSLSGCKRSSLTDEAAHDIRGQPINSVISKQSSPGSSGVGIAQGAPEASTNHADKVEQMDGDFLLVGFDKLSGYTFEVSDDLLAPATNDTAAASAKAEAQIPSTVKALDKKRVAVKGFMLPLKVEGGVVTEMLIMKDQSMCCYGVVPKINEWISIKMLKDGVKPIMDQPVTLYGMLRVGEMRENGYLVGIYAMDGEKMAAPTEN